MLVSITIKKTGLSYERDTDKLPQASRDYLMQNGFSQRLRDVHASVKRDDFESDNAYEQAVTEAVGTALNQIDTGDVPGSRQPASAETKAWRQVAATAKAAGVDITKIDPEKLLAYLERQNAAGRSA